MSKKKKITKLLEDAISNIIHDRKRASSLLDDVPTYIGQDQLRHISVGITAAKYLEVILKANEQIIKVAALINDIKDDEFGDLDKNEKENIYKEFEELPEQSEIEAKDSSKNDE